eukprot:Lithocolla_globosa_v1_NODE_1903_length_2264_cov_492.284744.p2 type:complete len:184 gc:universal NODE_1903_length_2264_cov_492.284744:2120-1569(-)
MACLELNFEQDVVLVALHLSQFLHPFGGLPVGYAWVMQASHHQHVGIRLFPHIVVRRVGQHVVKVLGLIRVAPLLPLARCERDGGVTHGVANIHKRDASQRDLEKVWPHVDDRTDQQTARRPALDGEFTGACNFLYFYQVLGTADEVGESVAFVEIFALLLIPISPHLPPTSDVGDDVGHAPV